MRASEPAGEILSEAKDLCLMRLLDSGIQNWHRRIPGNVSDPSAPSDSTIRLWNDFEFEILKSGKFDNPANVASVMRHTAIDDV